MPFTREFIWLVLAIGSILVRVQEQYGKTQIEFID